MKKKKKKKKKNRNSHYIFDKIKYQQVVIADQVNK